MAINSNLNEPPTRGQPPKRGQKLCSEVSLYHTMCVWLLYTLVFYTRCVVKSHHLISLNSILFIEWGIVPVTYVVLSYNKYGFSAYIQVI